MLIGPTSLLILQSTSFCNLDCSYCYLPDRDKKRFMPLETAKTAIDRLFEDGLVGQCLSLVWHAGEPLVVAREFYRAVAEHAARYAGETRIQHHFQTNGVLIDDAWCDLFSQIGARVGVSIDGPRDINDACRKSRTGGGTFDRALRGLRRLQERGINHHIISVLTQEGLRRSDDVFAFFADSRATSIGINIEEIEGLNGASTLSREDRRAASVFYSELIRRHFAGDFRSREVSGLDRAIAAGARGRGNDQITPLRLITVGTDGGFSTFSPELHGEEVDGRPFVFGNVKTDRYSDVFTNDFFLSVLDRILEGRSRCQRECRYFDLCGGGAPGNKYFENRDFASTETVYCNLRTKAMIDSFMSDPSAHSPVEPNLGNALAAG